LVWILTPLDRNGRDAQLSNFRKILFSNMRLSFNHMILLVSITLDST